MSTQIGNALYKFRVSRGLTLTELANEDLSPSFLSKVEHGTTGISIDRLFSLLKILHVSAAEFFREAHLIAYADFTDSYHTMTRAYENNNIDVLSAILAIEKKQVTTSISTQYHQHLAIIAEAFLNDLTQTQLSHSALNVLRDYLFTVESWHDYEILLFTATSLQLPAQTAIEFGKVLIKNTNVLMLQKDELEMIFAAFFNLVLKLVKEHSTFDYHLFLSYARTIAEQTADYNYQNKFNFLDGVMQILHGDVATGTQLSQHAIAIMREFNDATSANNHQRYLNSFLGN